jgi:hypothetical protein
MPMSTARITPPRWSRRILRTWLPDDGMRDAIEGDLHEEFVRDAARHGDDRARVRYRQRVAGIIGYVIFDAIRWRTWSSGPLAATAGSVPLPPRTAARSAPALVGRADMGLIAGAFGVLGVGIVVNTMLFSSVRDVSSAATTASRPALGLVSLLLALGSAAVAAGMLCVGPRWLRRRACRQAIEQRDAARHAADTSAMPAAVVSDLQP